MVLISNLHPRFLWKYTELTFKIFKCTGKNNYVALCEPEYISFGGGYAR